MSDNMDEPKKGQKPAQAKRAARPRAINAPAPETQPAPKAEKAAPRVYEFGNSADMLDLAKELAKFVKENNLAAGIHGKEYVNVEGWQYAGSNLGLSPIIEHIINNSSNEEIKYQAKVTILNIRTNATIGSGFAVCSNKESGKKFYQEFAIASMAQTRAIGKAYRNILAWLMRAAGYEPTPAEEMEYGGNEPEPAKVEGVTTANNIPQPLMATEAQKSKIRELCLFSEISHDEGASIQREMERFTEPYAEIYIGKLKNKIRERGGKLPEDANQSSENDNLPF